MKRCSHNESLRGFGMTLDIERGTTRHWYVGEDGVKRWADNDQPVERNGSRDRIVVKKV